jgi:hypothetical protein
MTAKKTTWGGFSGARVVSRRLLTGWALALAACSVGARAQQIAVPAAGAATTMASAPVLAAVPPGDIVPPPVNATPTIPILTPVMLRVDTAISSKTAKRGDRFGLTLAVDLMVDNQVLVPKGTRGEGEVVHAAGVGFGGRAGELILAARFLQLGETRLPLQSFRISKAGANNSAEAIGVMAAAGAVGAIAALFITGTSAEVAAGQIAIAKTAVAFSIAPPAATPSTNQGNHTK